MIQKLKFYNHHGVQEYYVYDPDYNRLEIYHRKNQKLEDCTRKDWISPLLKFRLSWTTETFELYQPDDLLSYLTPK